MFVSVGGSRAAERSFGRLFGRSRKLAPTTAAPCARNSRAIPLPIDARPNFISRAFYGRGQKERGRPKTGQGRGRRGERTNRGDNVSPLRISVGADLAVNMHMRLHCEERDLRASGAEVGRPRGRKSGRSLCALKKGCTTLRSHL